MSAPVTMPLFGAGTLSVPFNAEIKRFSTLYPNTTVQPQFGGSVKMVKQVTDLGQPADVVAVADYSVIPTYMLGQGGKQKFASWYVGFASNAITFVYTPKSKGADSINADNWYQILSEPGVEIGRSNPDTDPSGYQTLQMLKLAEQYYHEPGLSDAVLKNAPKTNMRDTETELLAALSAGQIDYLAIYVSDARQHNLQYLDLPSDINLSDPGKAAAYAAVSVSTSNGDIQGKPIIYALTVPLNAEHPEWAERFVAFVVGPEGQKIMSDNGFKVLNPAIASDTSAIPAGLQPLTVPWPSS